jgi:hypothetical protein
VSFPKTVPCSYCGAAMPVVGYVGAETCPGCGLVWEYDEGYRPTPESIRALVAAERARCEAIADVWADTRAGADILRRIREGTRP